jgi:hypothetical protein
VWDGANRKNHKVTYCTVTHLLVVEEDVITALGVPQILNYSEFTTNENNEKFSFIGYNAV